MVMQMSERYIKLENLIGKDIIDTNANKLGVVNELAFDTQLKSLVIMIPKDDHTKTYIPTETIEKIKDIILVKTQ